MQLFDHLGKYFHTMYVDSPRIGLCIPSHFTGSQVASMVNTFLRQFHIRVEIPEHQCTTKNKAIVLTTVQKVSLVFLASVLLVSLLATCLDYMHTYMYTLESTSKWNGTINILRCFSAIKGTQRLLASPQQFCEQDASLAREQDVQINAIHGIRVITMFWIVINHTYLLGGFFLLWIYSEWYIYICFFFSSFALILVLFFRSFSSGAQDERLKFEIGPPATCSSSSTMAG